MHPDAKQYINQLQLKAHPEGGYYKRTYQSTLHLPQQQLPISFNGNRLAASAIYFLLTSDSFSAFHKLQADELWHFYAGNTVTLFLISSNGDLNTLQLGNPIQSPKAQFQILVPPQTWFAAAVLEENSYALVGCTLSPAFDFEDFELGKRAYLLKEFPQHPHLIHQYTR